MATKKRGVRTTGEGLLDRTAILEEDNDNDYDDDEEKNAKQVKDGAMGNHGATISKWEMNLRRFEFFLFRLRRRYGLLKLFFCFMLVNFMFLILIYVTIFYSIDNKVAAVELMACTHDIFTRHNITYFFDYGTLLGAIRHEGFIPWDDVMDIDVGVLASQTDLINSVKQEFQDRNCGYMIHRTDVKSYPNVSAFVIRRAAFRIFYHRFIPIYIDIADYEEFPPEERPANDKDIPYVKDTHHPDLLFKFALNKLMPVSDCKFEGRIFNCPHDSPYVLEREFGTDWRTPKRDFKPEDVTDDLRVVD